MTQNYFIWILLLLFLGLVIYLLLRPDARVTVFFAETLGLRLPEPELLERLPAPVLCFLRGYAGDMLWAAGLTLAVYLLLQDVPGGLMITCLICCCFSFLMEYLQKQEIITGTWDIWDIVLEVVVSVCITLAIKFRKEDVK